MTVDEIVLGVNLALGSANVSACPAFGFPENSSVAISTIIQAVNDALNGCPTPPPTLSLSVHVARNPATHTVQVAADLTNSGQVPVSYLTGCSALCRPKIYRAISFELVGPHTHNTEVIVEEPCGGVLLCAEGPQVFSSGESVEQTLDITGIEWNQDSTIGGECGSCSQTPLEPGRYKVIARFQCAVDLNNPWPFPDYIEASGEFDWP